MRQCAKIMTHWYLCETLIPWQSILWQRKRLNRNRGWMFKKKGEFHTHAHLSRTNVGRIMKHMPQTQRQQDGTCCKDGSRAAGLYCYKLLLVHIHPEAFQYYFQFWVILSLFFPQEKFRISTHMVATWNQTSCTVRNHKSIWFIPRCSIYRLSVKICISAQWL